MLTLFVSLFIFELFSDVNLIIKIFVLMTLVSWVKNHVGEGPLSWILIAGMGYFILFDGWRLFGPIYVLYMLLMFGVSGVIIDFFFVGGGGAPEREGMESPVGSGIDVANRMAMHKAQQSQSVAQRIRGGR
ncbi:MAG: hypothetical protein NUV67_00410 [archaeon]|nr:hypothetical protein [archaeon]